MNDHFDAIMGALIANGVLSVTLLYVRSLPNMRPGLGWWAAGFGMNALRLSIYIGSPALNRDLAGFAAEYFQSVQVIFLLAGTMAFLGRELSTRMLAVACGLIAAWATMGSFVLHSFLVTTVPLYLATGAILVWSGILLLKGTHDGHNVGRAITGISFVLWGLHKLNFPFLRTVAWFAPWGFMIAQTLALIAALGIIVMALRTLQQRTEQEVTARIAAAAEVDRQNALIRSLVEHLPSSVAVKDMQGRFTLVNRTFAERQGLGQDEILGKTSYDILPPEIADEMVRRDRIVLETHEPHQERRELIDRQGKRCVLLSLRFPLLGPDGMMDGIGSISTDITPMQQAEDALRESETLYRSAFRTSPDAINLNRLSDGLYVDVNEGFTELTGFTREEAVGKTSAEIGIWADGKHREELVAGLQKYGQVSNLRVVFRLKDGRTSPALMSARVLTLQGIPHILSVSRDIARLQRTEEALLASERNLRQVLESTGEGIYAVDPEGRCTLCNPAAAHILGYDDPDDLLGCDIHQKIHHSHVDGTPYPGGDCQIHQAAMTGVPMYVDDEVFWRRDGRPIPVELQSNPVIDDGRVVGNVVSFSDITERRQAADRLRQAQKMEAVGQLTGGVAHDFNNILSVIQLNAEFLAEDLEGDMTSGDPVARIMRSVERATELTERLLAFSRRQELLPEIVDLGPMVCETAEMLRRSLGETIAITVRTDDDVPVVIVDRGQFENALLNLAINARDAMPQGGSLTIAIGRGRLPAEPSRNNGEFVCVSVSDSGTGMPPEVVERIFEPFFTTKRKGQGTGLGLSMVYGFVRQSGGDILVDSVPGDGTTFRLFFPAAAKAIPQVAATADDSRGDEIAELPSLTILLAEDDDNVRSATRMILANRGHRVIQAANGRKAFDILKRRTAIDLLLTDVVMPGGMSGRDLAEAAWTLDPGLKVLFASGYARGILSEDDMEPGRSAFIAKPYTRESLMRAVTSLWFAKQQEESR